MPPFLPYSIGNELRSDLNSIIPSNANQPYDIREVIEKVIDNDTFLRCINYLPKIL